MILVPILGDQLTLSNPALQGLKPQDALIVMAEVTEESQQIWSTRMRSALFLSAMRHFALELRQAGWTVQYLSLVENPHETLEQVWISAIAECQPSLMRVCEPGDWRIEQSLLSVAKTSGISIEILEDDHFLISRQAFKRWAGSSQFLRMEAFYRFMRQRTSILMQGKEPEGGQWNFDEQNRQSFGKKGPKDLQPARRFEVDTITRQVIAELAEKLPDQVGRVAAFDWPVTRAQALTALEKFIDVGLDRFGPPQDAMWKDEPFLFHSLISSSLNLKLLSPREVIDRALLAYENGQAQIASVEGFIRQILGWREFMRGVYWLDMPAMKAANHFGVKRALPTWYWTGQTNMQCMSQALKQSLERGYAHHIQRLMVIGNFALLAGLAPQEVCEWYLAAYVDAVEWVELPNTAGMALFANGGRFTTKPYIASGAYIKRMSNYCEGCAYDPSQKSGPRACPFTTLYWAFLDTHQQQLRGNPRAALMMKNFDRLSHTQLEEVREQARITFSQMESL